MVLGCCLLALEVPFLHYCSRFIATKPGLRADTVFVILMVLEPDLPDSADFAKFAYRLVFFLWMGSRVI